MYDLLRSILNFLGDMDWLAIVATMALNTWRQQIKARVQIDFIDELTDTIHDFILSMSAPVTSLKFAFIL